MLSDRGVQRFAAEEAREALTLWNIGDIDRLEPLAGGSRSSPKMVVHGTGGSFVLKRLSPSRDQGEHVRFAHSFIAVAARAGIPVASPVVSKAGKTLESLHGSAYELFPLIQGVRWSRTGAQAAAAGQILGRLHEAGLGLHWQGPVRATSFHGSLAVFEAIRRIPKKVCSVDASTDVGELQAVCEAIAIAYRQASQEVDELGYAAIDSQVVHGDFHPGNLLFQGDVIAGVIDFDAARLEPAVVDFANGVLQFASPGGSGAHVRSWPAALSEERVKAFMAGFTQHGDASIEMLVEMVPPLMIEACITEVSLPIARNGIFGSVRAIDMLAMVQRRVAWLEEHGGSLQRWLRWALSN